MVLGRVQVDLFLVLKHRLDQSAHSYLLGLPRSRQFDSCKKLEECNHYLNVECGCRWLAL